jgi:protein xylosyltransferase
VDHHNIPNVNQYEKDDDAGGQVRDGHRDRVVRHMQQLQNNTHVSPDLQRRNGAAKVPDAVWQDDGKLTTTTTTTSETSTSLSQQNKAKFDNVKPFPIPAEHHNCNLDEKKDALSAISRASSDECKELLHNVTCMQMAGLLYDTNIKRECWVKDSGRNFLAKPLNDVSDGARIVFLFSLHGRALRQVKRLFKAIYHKDHYFFIHVDSRSDYLHRNLYETFSDFPNVYFPTWRIATIWGGASLLQMLLRALEDLEFILTGWRWDYFVNLSESDYPLRANGDLVRFLKAHDGDNFVKTHGADISKFIQKQGLDRTFVECDNHMWRVDNRKLPGDITVDGGSDWIAIHRNYSRYLVTDQSDFLTGIKRYYEFSLLPAESFFHTVLRNGPMCHRFVKTNLRITNWNRKLGCRCQYKHVVDWCGCSPNDFLTKDIGRLQVSYTIHYGLYMH